MAKAVIGLPTTVMLIDRLMVDKPLRRLCGWEYRGELPSETTFSRAFAEFARSALPCHLHEALIKQAYKDRLVGRPRLRRRRGRNANAAGREKARWSRRRSCAASSARPA